MAISTSARTAHDLNGHTLTGLKRLMELVGDGGGRLSVVMVGPDLKPTLTRHGYRTKDLTELFDAKTAVKKCCAPGFRYEARGQFSLANNMSR